MSQDIRSFFNVLSTKKTKTVDGEKKKKPSRHLVISDSESDDESNKKNNTLSKSPTSVNKPASSKAAKGKTSHYFDNLKPANPIDVFSSAPVKQTGIHVKKKKDPTKAAKGKVKLSNDDDDFDAVFSQLDDDAMNLLMSNTPCNKDTEDVNKHQDNSSVPRTSEGHHISDSAINGMKEDRNSPQAKRRKITEKNHNSKTKSPEINCKKDPNTPVKSKKNSCSPLKSSNIKANSTTKNDEKVNKKNIYKSDCMDLSESDDEEEAVFSKIKSEPSKRKNESSDIKTPSPKKQKLTFEVKEANKTICNSISNKNIESSSVNKVTKISKRDTNTENVNKSKSDKRISHIEMSKPVKIVPIVSNLWVDKYKPTNVKQLIGQQGDKSNVKKLTNWLTNWKKNHNGKTKLARPSPWAKNDDGSFFKAALLSGPPGLGKTTTAHLVCKELGYDMVEFNASDTRSKKLLQQEVSELLSTKSLAPYFTGASNHEVSSKHVLVMDEVDGMAGNEDRGGIQELIQLIKMARIPVICMCNDRNHPKMRSLVNYCYDLRFSRPRVEQIKGAMMSICFKEGLKISSDQLTEVIRSTNQDIRLVLNHLSVVAAQQDTTLANSEKFIKLGPWDVTRKIFSEEELNKMSFQDKSDLFFHDYSITPLFVQENYLSVVPHAKLNKFEKMNAFAKAAESIAKGDIVEKTIRSSNAWSLLPVEAVFASVVPGETLKGHVGGQINFPAWLGKNSSRNKMDRLQQELLVHTRLKASGSKESINLDYSSHLRNLIVRPLVEQGADGVTDSLNALHNYDLLKEDFENLNELCKWPNTADPMAKVESKVKAAFTRAYNKSSGLSPYAVTAPIKKGRGVEGGSDINDIYPENSETVVSEEEGDDSIEVDAMIMAKKKTNTKKEEPSTSKKGDSKRGGGRGRKKNS